MARKLKTCAVDHVPIVELAFEKKACEHFPSEKLTTAIQAAEFIRKHWGCKPVEYFLVVALSSDNRVLAVQEASKGGFSNTQVDPRVVFGGALMSGAAALILAHNHPSGNNTPSQMDHQMTAHLAKGAQFLGLTILDHIIVSRTGFYSFAEHGEMPRHFAGYGRRR